MRFQAKLIPSGNATGVEIPADVVLALGPQARPPISITINGHCWRSRVAAMRGQRLIGISAAHRAAAGIHEGDIIEIDVEVDEAPREVVEPADLADALNTCQPERPSSNWLSDFGKNTSTQYRNQKAKRCGSAASPN